MKSKEFITEATEKRYPTGVGKTTVLDPSTYTGGSYNPSVKIIDKYSGDPMSKDIGNVQERNFDALSAILKRSKQKFKYLGWVAYEGDLDYTRRYDTANKGKVAKLTRFIMLSPGLVWEKYEGSTAGGGRNTVFVGGRKMKLTVFLKLDPKRQDALVKMKPEDQDKDFMSTIPPKVKNADLKKFYKQWHQVINNTQYEQLGRLVKKGKENWNVSDWKRFVNIADGLV